MTTILREQLSEVIRSALEASMDPAMAAADWFARDIDPNCSGAIDLITGANVQLEQLQQAKSAFKTMRVLGELSADRRLAAKLYAASIAAGLVRFNTRISRQSDDALRRGLQTLLDDAKMPDPLRDLAGGALCVLNDHR